LCVDQDSIIVDGYQSFFANSCAEIAAQGKCSPAAFLLAGMVQLICPQSCKVKDHCKGV
jgi:hypothetical protein